MSQMNTEQLLSKWLNDYSGTDSSRGLLRVTRAEPRFQTRNYFARFKVEFATFDGTGQSPTDAQCLVVEVSTTDQTAKVASEPGCDAVRSL
jgi:hypothetical protein